MAQLENQRASVYRLDESRPKLAMHSNRRADDIAHDSLGCGGNRLMAFVCLVFFVVL